MHRVHIKKQDYEPGDVLPTGEIIVGSTALLAFGIAYVTRGQAKAARKHGWRIIHGTSDDGHLVRIRR